MPKITLAERRAKVRADADTAEYAAKTLARALDAGDDAAALEAAQALEAIGCRARRYVNAATGA